MEKKYIEKYKMETSNHYYIFNRSLYLFFINYKEVVSFEKKLTNS
ncbi:hypothetical protein GCM10011384_17240 [Psychrobacillus lasiicapitis]|nr:hypothetical protein GCM10011384_17240 [Psychrobacillus lasiicapitis]